MEKQSERSRAGREGIQAERYSSPTAETPPRAKTYLTDVPPRFLAKGLGSGTELYPETENMWL